MLPRTANQEAAPGPLGQHLERNLVAALLALVSSHLQVAIPSPAPSNAVAASSAGPSLLELHVQRAHPGLSLSSFLSSSVAWFVPVVC